MNEKHMITVSVRGEEIVLRTMVYTPLTEKGMDIVVAEYPLDLEDAEQLIDIIQEGISILKEDEEEEPWTRTLSFFQAREFYIPFYDRKIEIIFYWTVIL